MNRLTIKEGLLHINGKLKGCVVQAVSCNGEIVWKEDTMLLASGIERTFNGYDVANISIAIIILEPEEDTKLRYEDLSIINYSFKQMEDETAALWNLEADVFRALGIKQARYVNFEYTTQDDSILCTLELREEQPTEAIIQEQQKEISKALEEEPSVSEPEMTKKEEALLRKVESYYQEV